MRAVLTYHSVDPSGSVISVDEETLGRHIDFLASSSIRVLPLDEIVAWEGEGDAVALTFDDGFANFATAAWPRLAEAGLPATVFVVTDRVGSDNRWPGDTYMGVPTMPLMDWDTLGRLADEGLDLGSHTRTHRRMPSLGDAEIDDELLGSCEAMQSAIGVTPRSLAYPYGDHDDRVAERSAGVYASAWTTELRLVQGGESAHEMPRLDAYYLREAGRLEAFGRRGFAAFVARRAFLRRMRARIEPVLGGGGS
jgi:peptidoglycan/xylan/chitin deacetylase (PgdA/CDA1 family)